MLCLFSCRISAYSCTVCVSVVSFHTFNSVQVPFPSWSIVLIAALKSDILTSGPFRGFSLLLFPLRIGNVLVSFMLYSFRLHFYIVHMLGPSANLSSGDETLAPFVCKCYGFSALTQRGEWGFHEHVSWVLLAFPIVCACVCGCVCARTDVGTLMWTQVLLSLFFRGSTKTRVF